MKPSAERCPNPLLERTGTTELSSEWALQRVEELKESRKVKEGALQRAHQVTSPTIAAGKVAKCTSGGTYIYPSGALAFLPLSWAQSWRSWCPLSLHQCRASWRRRVGGHSHPALRWTPWLCLLQEITRTEQFHCKLSYKESKNNICFHSSSDWFIAPPGQWNHKRRTNCRIDIFPSTTC